MLLNTRGKEFNLENTFIKLNAINVSDHVERKNGLSYLSWPFAWSELKTLYPRSYYTIYENSEGRNYHHDGKTCWVKTGITLVTDEENLEHIEYLPIMDFRNASIPLERVTSFDVNKAIQRSLTKAVARHGVGLYIYAGEDLPEDTKQQKEATNVMSEIEIAISNIDKTAKSLPSKGVDKAEIGKTIKSACGTPNYKKITDIAVAKKVLEELKKLGGNN